MSEISCIIWKSKKGAQKHMVASITVLLSELAFPQHQKSPISSYSWCNLRFLINPGGQRTLCALCQWTQQHPALLSHQNQQQQLRNHSAGNKAFAALGPHHTLHKLQMGSHGKSQRGSYKGETQHFCGDPTAVLGPGAKLGAVLRGVIALGECC